MRITARPLHDHPVTIEPSPPERRWPDTDQALFADPSLQAATSRGWDLLCPYSFEAVWNGGPNPEDVQIDAPGFALSRLGHGIVSFQTGYEFGLEPGHLLWVRGPINQLKDGIQPLDQVIEQDLLPFVGEVHWRFTRANQPVRFARGEPFATLLPYPAGYIEQFHGEIEQGERGLPAVSCICPTFARPALLEEAIQSFLLQDYGGPKELIVLNDYPGQTLAFDHPEVQIVNVPRRFRTLGEKLNAAVALCSHDVICVWNDDDVYLPHRLSLTVARIDPGKGFFKGARAFFWNDGRITDLARNGFHGGSCWSRDLFAAVRGYPHTNAAADQEIESRFLRERFESAYATELTPEETYYLYRWAGTGSYHLSAAAPGNADPEAGYAAAAAWVDAEAARGHIPQGRIELRPAWRQDYAEQALAFLATRSAEQPAAPAQAAPEPPIVFSALPRPVPEREAIALFRGDAPARISVVLPACNESTFLRRTFEQFEATLPAGSEILVVDNGSGDGCADFLEPRAELIAPATACTAERRLPPDGCCVAARLIQTRDPLGVAGARNLGLAHAAGEVIVFADAHVDVPPGWWPPLVAALNRPGVGLVGPAFGVMGNPDYAKMYGQRILDAKLRTEWLPKLGDEPYPVPVLGGGFLAARAAVLAEVGGFDPGMQQWGSEDLEISLRMWLLGHEVWIVPELEVPHYFRESNPYRVEWKYVLSNQLRTVFLHLSGERLTRGIHGLMQDPAFPRALALCADSDLWSRRAELLARRVHDDDWFFNHPYFAAMEMGH